MVGITAGQIEKREKTLKKKKEEEKEKGEKFIRKIG
jgi:hypothetical protein